MGQYWTEVAVRGVVIDPMTGDPAILLEDSAESALITIPADPGGVEAIICELEGIHRDAPQSLLYRFFVRHGIRVSRLEIGLDPTRDLSSALCYRHQDQSFRMDARPSDGIALAILSGAPLFASTELILDQSRAAYAPRITESHDLLILSAHTDSRFSTSK